MLGARARAAEYNAYKAASARQASHEAEEQKMPPKAAPVSLGAFTKPAQPTRNKGAKAWKPLVLDDTAPEEEPEKSEDGKFSFSTQALQAGGHGSNTGIHNKKTAISPQGPHPLRVDNKANGVGALSLQSTNNNDINNSETPLSPRSLQLARTKPPTFGIPPAPITFYAPLEEDDEPGLANPTSQHPQPQPILAQAPQAILPSVNSSPNSFSGPSVFPYPPAMWQHYVPGPPPVDLHQMPFFYSGQADSGFMVPTDISPTKQENKFASMSGQNTGSSLETTASHQYISSSPATVGNSTYAPPPFYPYGPGPGGRNPHPPLGTVAPNTLHRSPIKHGKSNSITYPNAGRGAPAMCSNNRRRLSYPSPRAPFHRPPPHTRNGPGVTAHGVQQKSPATPNKRSYDRSSKMQNFAAAQQSLGKGKTVLRNPDLNRATAGSETSTPTRDPRRGPTDDTLVPGPHNALILLPRPELEATINSSISEPNDTGIYVASSQASLQKEFGVGTDEWHELKPVTKSQRMLMNKAMRLCAIAESPDPPKASLQNKYPDRHEKLQRWVQPGQSDSPGRKKAVNQVAKEHLSSRLSNTSGNDGVESGFAQAATIESASISAVGNILANLTDSVESTGSAAEHGPSLSKYKPAPEYAIERGRFLPGNSGGSSTSFFEDANSGFYTAPSRIARDPRFRPPSKDELKAKSEEDWKARPDRWWTRRRM